MNGAYIVAVTLLIILWIFILLLCITPWFGMAMLPYIVLFTFVGAAIILLVIFAFNQDAFTDVGWETLVILVLLLGALFVGIFVGWYFIRKYLKRYAHEVVHNPRKIYDECGNEIGVDRRNLAEYDREFHHDNHHHNHHRDFSNTLLTPEAYHRKDHHHHESVYDEIDIKEKIKIEDHGNKFKEVKEIIIEKPKTRWNECSQYKTNQCKTNQCESQCENVVTITDDY